MLKPKANCFKHMIFDVGIETVQPNQIERVIAIPTYYESATVPTLIAELVKDLDQNDAIFVMDDSPLDTYNLTKSKVLEVSKVQNVLYISCHLPIRAEGELQFAEECSQQ